jgi:lipoprotein-anchoring transpeptidase ErfK/SrfK
MSDLTRRFLLAGAASLLSGVAPAAAQYARGLADDDDGFYNTRPRSGDESRPAYGRRRQDTNWPPADTDQDPGAARGGVASPYDGDPASDPYYEGPYGPRATGRPSPTVSAGEGGRMDYARIYSAAIGEPFPVPAVRWTGFNPAFLRQPVNYAGSEAPGTIIIDPRAHQLTLVQEGGRAMRYGVGVGKQGFSWSGVATINSKQEWPDWYPPKEMIARQPALARQVSQLQSGVGVPGGPHNPLGARAMYLWQGNKDTLFRIHGTTEPQSIGKSVSSGCIRMINQDAIDLYRRVPIGARVVVLG